MQVLVVAGEVVVLLDESGVLLLEVGVLAEELLVLGRQERVLLLLFYQVVFQRSLPGLVLPLDLPQLT